LGSGRVVVGEETVQRLLTYVKINMLQKAFLALLFQSMPIPLWQEIKLRADLWKHRQGRERFENSIFSEKVEITK